MLVHPYEAINCQEIGEGNLGVIIEGSLHPSKPGTEVNSLNLVSWPIGRLTLENGKPLIDEKFSSTIHGIENVMEESVDCVENMFGTTNSDDEHDDGITHNNDNDKCASGGGENRA